MCVHLEILATSVALNYGYTWELYVKLFFTLLFFFNGLMSALVISLKVKL